MGLPAVSVTMPVISGRSDTSFCAVGGEGASLALVVVAGEGTVGEVSASSQPATRNSAAPIHNPSFFRLIITYMLHPRADSNLPPHGPGAYTSLGIRRRVDPGRPSRLVGGD